METSSGNIPTCCLWLDLIPLMVEVADEAAPPLYRSGVEAMSHLPSMLDVSNLSGSVPSILVVLGLSSLVPLGAPSSSL